MSLFLVIFFSTICLMLAVIIFFQEDFAKDELPEGEAEKHGFLIVPDFFIDPYFHWYFLSFGFGLKIGIFVHIEKAKTCMVPRHLNEKTA